MYKEPSNKQLLLYIWWRLAKYKKYHHVIAHGAVRTGKTLFLTLGFTDWMEETVINTPHEHRVLHWNNFAVIAQSRDNAHDTVIEPMMEYLVSKGYIQVHRYDHMSHRKCFFNNAGNSSLMIKNKNDVWRVKYIGANNKRSIRTIQGRTLRGTLIDESALIGMDLWERIENRHITFRDYKIFETSNPEGDDSHPYYENVIRNGEAKGFLVINFNLLDNPIFTESDVEYFERIYTPEVFKRNVLGLWVRGTGSIYKKFNDIQHVKSLYDNAKRSDYVELNIGVDYGERDATTFVLNGMKHHYKGMDFLKEYYFKDGVDGEKDIMEKLDDFMEFTLEVYNKFNKKINVYIDSSTHGKSFHKLAKNRLKARNINWLEMHLVDKVPQIKNSKSGVKDRIYTMNAMLGSMFVRFDKQCKQLKLGVKRAAWAKDKEERLDDGTTNIDILDAAEYSYVKNIPNILKAIEQYGGR